MQSSAEEFAHKCLPEARRLVWPGQGTVWHPEIFYAEKKSLGLFKAYLLAEMQIPFWKLNLLYLFKIFIEAACNKIKAIIKSEQPLYNDIILSVLSLPYKPESKNLSEYPYS